MAEGRREYIIHDYYDSWSIVEFIVFIYKAPISEGRDDTFKRKKKQNSMEEYE